MGLKRKQRAIDDLIDDFLNDKCPVFKYELIYEFRKQLCARGFMMDKKGSNIRSQNPVACNSIAGKSFKLNHGNLITKETFIYNQAHCKSEAVKNEN